MGNENGNSKIELIKADSAPFKTKPTDPGGKIIANQDKASYEKVAGESEEKIDQESLISKTEEPANIVLPSSIKENTVAETSLPEKSDDRLGESKDTEQVAANGNGSSVTPRVVQTVTVKPDGTIINKAPQTPKPLANSIQQAVQNGIDKTGVGKNSVKLPAVKTVKTAIVAKPQPIDGAKTRGDLAVPEASPLPKPVAPKPVQVAKVTAAPKIRPAAPAPKPVATPSSPAATSEWVVQVSSQRSAEAAQSSYQKMANRFGALQGRAVSIQKANVKGVTYHRVRLQTASKADANQLCSRLKAQGGNCFVTR